MVTGGLKAEKDPDFWEDARLMTLYEEVQKTGLPRTKVLLVRPSATYLLSAYPLADDEGKAIHPGMELFARELDQRLSTLGTYLSATYQLADQELPGAEAWSMPVNDTLDPQKVRFATLIPRDSLLSAVALPLSISLGLQILVMGGLAFMLRWILGSMRRMSSDQEAKALALDNFRQHSGEIKSVLEALGVFFSQLETTSHLILDSQQQVLDSLQKAGELTLSEAARAEQARTGLALMASEQSKARGALEADVVALQDIVEAVGQLEDSTENLKQGATQTAKLGTELDQTSQEGRSAMAEHSQQVARLRENSDSIGGLAGLITDISARTNLLSINAAIEAARAGTAGRGFSVVAQEIRNLSANIQQRIQQIETVVTASRASAEQALGTSQAVLRDFDRLAELATANQQVQLTLDKSTGNQVALGQVLVTQVKRLRETSDSLRQLFSSQQTDLESLERRAGVSLDQSKEAQVVMERSLALFRELGRRLAEFEQQNLLARTILGTLEEILKKLT